MPSMKHRLFALALLASSAAAHAHITLETRSAEAGSYYKAVFKVGHGCEGSAIREIIVQIPAGVVGAKPMPKAGWQIAIEKSALPLPYSSHGKHITEAPSVIRWHGGELPDAHYDEFVLVARLPEQPARLYWPVSQVCQNGRIDWSTLPEAGKKPSDYPTPAAILDVTPKADSPAGHKH